MIQRTFFIGDEWLYFKIYTSDSLSNQIITSTLSAFTSDLLKRNLIDKWFFIRYYDPDFHIRLRLHLTDSLEVGQAINIFRDYFKHNIYNKEIYRIALDVYEREIERYGYNTIIDCEDFFYIDSVITVNFLCNNSTEKSKILEAVLRTDYILHNLGYDIEEQKKISERMASSYIRELGIPSSHEINKLYREFKQTIYNMMIYESSNDIRFKNYNFHNLNKLQDIQITTSLIHMSVNRIFSFHQRWYEMIVYHFLWKYYNSMISRGIK